MTTARGGTPLQPHVATETRECARCGERTEHRRHRVGLRDDGTVHYRWRCRPCHNARRRAARQ